MAYRKASYTALAVADKQEARGKAASQMLQRVGEIIQRRHDIVHNCDRPKSAKQPLTLAAAKKMLTDVEDFVTLLDDHLDAHRAYWRAWRRPEGWWSIRGLAARRLALPDDARMSLDLQTDLSGGLDLTARCHELTTEPVNAEDAEGLPDAWFDCRLFSHGARSQVIQLSWDEADHPIGGRYSAVVGDYVLF